MSSLQAAAKVRRARGGWESRRARRAHRAGFPSPLRPASLPAPALTASTRRGPAAAVVSRPPAVVGTLKGFDPLVNVVLDDCVEYFYREEDGGKETTRTLGLVVGRGTSVVLVCPTDGMEAIENPFAEEG